MPKKFCRESCVCVTRNKIGQFKKVVPSSECSVLYPRTPHKTVTRHYERPKHPMKEAKRVAPTTKTGVKLDVGDFSKCSGKTILAKIQIDDNFEVHDTVQNGGKRSMNRKCPTDDSQGNVCIAEQAMRFRGILQKKDKDCILEIPKMEFSPKAKEIWKQNDALMKAGQEKYDEKKKEVEKECEKLQPWECDRLERRIGKAPIHFTKTQQKHINAIKGEEPLI